MIQRDMTTIPSVAHLSDQQLLAGIKTLASDDRRATAALVASLAELDARRLYLREGCISQSTPPMAASRLPGRHGAFP